ncbi:MAG: RsmB/NOP family class I SAM-dependent RNA methyltransferase, partial [Nanoarchaeota archaeon]
LPIIAMKPEQNEMVLDLCAAPGSKTTQTASEMCNSGTIIANEVNMGRLKILASNLERCGVTNTIIARKDGILLCKTMAKGMRLPSEAMKEVAVQGLGESRRKPTGCLRFDRILIDAPCSGEGTLRSSPKTYIMWNPKTIKKLSRLQIRLVESALEILKPNGTLIYSTCTHAPEENEGVVDYILNEFKGEVKLEKINLPIKHREGIIEWKDKEFSKEVKKCARIYPHDADTEGFFIAKFRRLG